MSIAADGKGCAHPDVQNVGFFLSVSKWISRHAYLLFWPTSCFPASAFVFFSFHQVANMAAPTPAQIQYMEAHISDDRRPGLIASVVIPLSIASIAVVLRFIARRRVRAPLLADDWLILASLVCYPPTTASRVVLDILSADPFSGKQIITSCYDISAIFTIHNGVGRHIILVTNAKALIQVAYSPSCLIGLMQIYVLLTCTVGRYYIGNSLLYLPRTNQNIHSPSLSSHFPLQTSLCRFNHHWCDRDMLLHCPSHIIRASMYTAFIAMDRQVAFLIHYYALSNPNCVQIGEPGRCFSTNPLFKVTA